MKQAPRPTTLAAALLPVIALFAASATAQVQPPGIGDALHQVPPAQGPQKPQPALPAVGNLPLEAPLQKLPGAKVEVRQFKIVGNTAIGAEELLALVKPAEGQTLTLGQLEEQAGNITRHYRAKGYFVARAYLPGQEVSEGVITIRVLEGHYGKFVLKNTSLVGDAAIQGALDQAKGADAVSLASLERAMLNVNNLPGAVLARADILPGEQVGTSDFLVTADATPRVDGYLTGDNYGSVYTGRQRVGAGLAVNSPLGLGDKLSASGLLSDNQDLKNYRFAYSAPLAANGLRGELAASRTDYQLGGTYAALDALGRADTVEATLTYPFVRSQARALEGSLNVAHRKLRDEVRSAVSVVPKTADVLTASLMARTDSPLCGLAGQTTVLAAATLGRLDIQDATALALDAAGAGTQGRYGKLALSVSRLTQLPHDLTLNTGLRLQHALFGKNLDGSEDMSISGASGVKVYPPGELAAENAALLNVELQYALPAVGAYSSRLGVFADAGRATEQHAVGDSRARSLSDIGISYNASYRSFFATVQIASRTSRAATSEAAAPTRILLQLGAAF